MKKFNGPVEEAIQEVFVLPNLTPEVKKAIRKSIKTLRVTKSFQKQPLPPGLTVSFIDALIAGLGKVQQGIKAKKAPTAPTSRVRSTMVTGASLSAAPPA